jgi:hypothetical protein
MLLLLLWLLGTFSYPVVAGALLWPSLPQAKALRWGKFLHLVIGLPLILTQILTLRLAHPSVLGLIWVTYAALWFRIRESYPTFLSNDSIESRN